MRTVVNACELAAEGAHALAHVLVNLRERRLVVEAAADAGLIRDDGNHEAPAVQRRDRLEAARDGPPLGDRLDELAGVLVDDAVAVDHDEAPPLCHRLKPRAARSTHLRARRRRRASARSY